MKIKRNDTSNYKNSFIDIQIRNKKLKNSTKAYNYICNSMDLLFARRITVSLVM